MSDETGGGQGGGGNQDGGQQQQQQQQQQSAPPEWMASLPDDLKADQTLTRYATLDDLAKGHLETKRIASSKVLVPGEGADAAAMQSFYEAIGRPKEASAYEIDVPEGSPADLADAARGKFHELGLRPEQAKGIAGFWNEFQKGQLDKIMSDSQAELDAFKAATPDYEAQLSGVKALAVKLGIDPDTANQLDVKLGTANLMKFMFGLNKMAGEAGRIDGDREENGGINTADAAGQLRTLNASEEHRNKIKANDPTEMRRRAILTEAANRQRGAPQKAA